MRSGATQASESPSRQAPVFGTDDRYSSRPDATARSRGRASLPDELVAALRRLQSGLAEGTPALSPTQGALLHLVWSRPGITVAEARRALRLGIAPLKVQVNRLLMAGLLERTPQPDRNGARCLYPTPLTHSHFERERHRVDDAVEALPAEDQDALLAAVPALERLAAQVMAL